MNQPVEASLAGLASKGSENKMERPKIDVKLRSVVWVARKALSAKLYKAS